MKEEIKKILQNLEKEKKIKIIFAIENGSRAWGMASKDSDYDVRFVYHRPLEDYIQIHRPAEVIQAAFDKNFQPCPIQGSLIDLSGFDIFKYVNMLTSSNPTAIEWLTTDIIYYGKQNSVFKKFVTQNFNPIALYHHYKSMCRNNYLKYLKSGSEVTYKKYLYTYRGLINAKWVIHKKSLPPINFIDAVHQMEDVLPNNITHKLEFIIKEKAKGNEKKIVKNIPSMDTYVEAFLKDTKEIPKERSHATVNSLNKEIRRIILKNENL